MATSMRQGVENSVEQFRDHPRITFAMVLLLAYYFAWVAWVYTTGVPPDLLRDGAIIGGSVGMLAYGHLTRLACSAGGNND